MSRLFRFTACVAASLVVVACSGGGSGDPAPLVIAPEPHSESAAPESPASSTSTTVTAEAGGPAVGAAELLRSGTVRVSTTGTFVSPEFGAVDSVAGSGSAFFVDASGFAVTNNHVVAGAAIVEVFLDGSDAGIPASIVATAECADLAVIQVHGDGFTPVLWADRGAPTGTAVRAVGYPDGDRQIAFSDGIVAREAVSGATPWASIPSLLQHDADLRKGNSGGPLVDFSGRVVGVNTAASPSGRFAVPATVAEPIVAELMSGVDVDSIGLNALAVVDEVSNEAGVWVVSVRPGSPADQAGLRAGDIVTRMKGVRVALDGTLADYCGVLRSTGSDPIPVEVVRDGSVWAGSVNGAELEPVLAVVNDTRTEAAAPSVGVAPPPGSPYVGFERVLDDLGVLAVDVPSAWSDRRTAPVSIGGVDRPAISASTDLDALDAAIGGSYDVPGVAIASFGVGASMDETFEIIVDNSPWRWDCVTDAADRFDDGTYRGAFGVFADCNGTGAMVVTMAIERIGSGRWMLLNVFAPTLADIEAAIRVVETFDVVPGADDLVGGADEPSFADLDEGADADGTDDPNTAGDAGGGGARGGRNRSVEVSELPATTALLDVIGSPDPSARLLGSTDDGTTATRDFLLQIDRESLVSWMEAAGERAGCDVVSVVADESQPIVVLDLFCLIEYSDDLVLVSLLASIDSSNAYVTALVAVS